MHLCVGGFFVSVCGQEEAYIRRNKCRIPISAWRTVTVGA